MKESKIQEDTIKLLRKNRMAVFAIEFRGRRGCPDLMVFELDNPRCVVFLELKTATGKRSEHQIYTAAEFVICGQSVGVTRTPAEALEFCNARFNECKQVRNGDESEAANKVQKDDAENVRHLPRKKAVSRVSDIVD